MKSPLSTNDSDRLFSRGAAIGGDDMALQLQRSIKKSEPSSLVQNPCLGEIQNRPITNFQRYSNRSPSPLPKRQSQATPFNQTIKPAAAATAAESSDKKGEILNLSSHLLLPSYSSGLSSLQEEAKGEYTFSLPLTGDKATAC